MFGRASEVSRGSAPAAAGVGPSLPLTRRRFAVIFGGLFALWLVIVFAGQAGEAATASNQADLLRARNAAIKADIESLQKELVLIQQPAFVAQMARAYLLGSPREIPFVIDPNASPLPDDAPGSVGIQSNVATEKESPLEAWLQALFGSGS
jgi:hypothetical protein